MDSRLKECPLNAFGCKWKGTHEELQNEHREKCFFLQHKTSFCSGKFLIICLIFFVFLFFLIWTQMRFFDENKFSMFLKEKLEHKLSILNNQIDLLNFYKSQVHIQMLTDYEAKSID